MAGLFVPLSSFRAWAQRAGDPLAQDRTLQSTIAAARKAGIPVTPQELRRPVLPPVLNAAPLYRQWHDLRYKSKRITSDDEMVLEALQSPKATPEQFARAYRLLDEKKDVFALLHQTVARRRCNFEKDYSLGPALVSPELADMRSMARFLRGESAQLLHDGKAEEAIHTTALVFSIVSHLLQEQTVISHQLAFAVDRIALNELGRILFAAGDHPTVRSAILQALRDRRPTPSPAETLRGRIAAGVAMVEILRWSEEKLRSAFEIPTDGSGEDANLIGVFRSLSAVDSITLDDPDDAVKPIVLTINDAMPSRKDRAAYAAWVDANKRSTILTLYQMLSQLNKPFEQYIGAEAGIVLGLQKEAANAFTNEGAKPSSNVIASLYAQDTYEILRERTNDYSQARGEILRAATLLLGFKAVHGAFPEQLGEAVSPEPIDPFDLKSLKYRREGDGFVLYAVGRNHHFDGGQANSQIGPTEAGMRYPTPTISQ